MLFYLLTVMLSSSDCEAGNDWYIHWLKDVSKCYLILSNAYCIVQKSGTIWNSFMLIEQEMRSNAGSVSPDVIVFLEYFRLWGTELTSPLSSLWFAKIMWSKGPRPTYATTVTPAYLGRGNVWKGKLSVWVFWYLLQVVVRLFDGCLTPVKEWFPVAILSRLKNCDVASLLWYWLRRPLYPVS